MMNTVGRVCAKACTLVVRKGYAAEASRLILDTMEREGVFERRNIRPEEVRMAVAACSLILNRLAASATVIDADEVFEKGGDTHRSHERESTRRHAA